MPAWFIGVLGPNPPVATLVGEWQLSQAIPLIGRWFDGGSLSVGGAMLANVSPDAWQVAQPLVIPAWPVAPIPV